MALQQPPPQQASSIAIPLIRWKYLEVIQQDEETPINLNKYANQGWELVVTSSDTKDGYRHKFYFKKKVAIFPVPFRNIEITVSV